MKITKAEHEALAREITDSLEARHLDENGKPRGTVKAPTPWELLREIKSHSLFQGVKIIPQMQMTKIINTYPHGNVLPEEDYTLPEAIPIMWHGTIPLFEGHIQLRPPYWNSPQMSLHVPYNSKYQNVFGRAASNPAWVNKFKEIKEALETNCPTAAKLLEYAPQWAREFPTGIKIIAKRDEQNARRRETKKTKPAPIEKIKIDTTAIAKARLLGGSQHVSN